MTSMPASRNARAITLAPRSWPSSPGLATSTRIFRSEAIWKDSIKRRRGDQVLYCAYESIPKRSEDRYLLAHRSGAYARRPPDKNRTSHPVLVEPGLKDKLMGGDLRQAYSLRSPTHARSKC